MPAAFAALVWTLAIAATLPRSEAAAMTASGGDVPLFHSIDDEFAYAASVVPGGFGGWYYDEQGRPNVFLIDTTQSEEATAALMPFLKDRHISLPGRSTPDVDHFVIRQGQYDYRDLLRWREQITGLVGQVPGLMRMDVAEERNRVLISVEDDAAERRLRSAMAELGIPAQAVLTELLPREEEEAPVTDDSPLLDAPAQGTITLRSRAVAPTGGYRIHFAVGDGEYGACTLGFLARWRGPPGTPATRSLRQVFVTNSHCGARFRFTGTRMFQGDLLTNRRSRTESAWLLGAEIYDFEGLIGTDPAGCDRITDPARNDGKCCPVRIAADRPVRSQEPEIRCRYSDAAVIAWTPGAGGIPRQWAFGTIARLLDTYRDPLIPTPLRTALDHRDSSLAKVTVDAANPVYRIAGEKAYSEYGELLHTVGAVTGWKEGKLFRSCFHSPTDDKQENKILRCQDETTLRPRKGDSGSPVYSFWRPTNPNDPRARLSPDRRREWVYLRGILAGGAGSFSTMADVEDEMGELETFDCIPENPDYPNCKTARNTRSMGRPPRYVPGSADEAYWWKLGQPMPTQPTTVTPTRPER